MALRVTLHAKTRWEERFPGQDLVLAFTRARRPGHKLRPQIKAACPAHTHLMRRDSERFYYLITRNRIVFVVAIPETIVTVFRLPFRGEINGVRFSEQDKENGN